MRRNFLVCLAMLGIASAQTTKSDSPDLTKQPTVYVVGYAHLDTEWRWEYPTTIGTYILNTMHDNFALFEKYPHYVFNFSGANRYRMMKEYFPADYERVKKYVAAGRWFPAGSAMEESDVNSPNAESIIRQILYGKEYFRKDFGKTSAEYMLPDCFGFPASLPSILAHTGIKGFSTQKLSSGWQPAPHVGGPNSPEKTPEGIPFNVGIWEGTDGKSVMAALNPGNYGGSVNYDISKAPPAPPAPPVMTPEQLAAMSPQQRQMAGRARPALEDWTQRTKINGDLTGIYADYHYYGTGDVGGAPNEASVKLMEAIVTKGRIAEPTPFAFGGRGGRGGRGAQAETTAPAPPPEVTVGDGPVKILSANSEQMFLDIKPEQTSKMPKYKGDLELINHSAGSITSETYMKRWNRKNEILADAAEKASVAAELLGARAYPLQRLTDAWTLVMGGQFHDIIPGTATPTAYEFAWNDQILAMNQFAGVLTSATEAVASGLNTQTKGTPVVVYNSLNIAREDVVEAKVSLPAGATGVRVTGPDGKDVPAQLAENGKVLFLAKVPAVGYAVYDVQAGSAASSAILKATDSSLENARYSLKINSAGDITSVFDKQVKKELLSAPIHLVVINDNPRNWPAWNMDFDQEIAPPRTIIGGSAKIRVVENGPVRVALEVSREAEDSKFVQTVRLSAGDAGNRVEIGNVIDWKAKEANLKATFALTASNPMATYNWDIGTIERPNENERQFEVASHQWVDLTDKSGTYGVTLLTDCKNASDKPADNALRLTLLRTPGTRGGYADQGSQDWGHHEFVYGLAGHTGDFRSAQTDWQAYRLNTPLVAFETAKHAGALKKEFSLVTINNSRIRVLALKKAEQSDEVVIRMVEIDGKPAPNVQVSFAAPITAAREVNGAEEPVGAATVAAGKLATSFTAFQPRTFAVKLGTPPVKLAAVDSKPVTLAYDLAVASNDDTKTIGGFDSKNEAIPAEMLPAQLTFQGVQFQLGPAKTGSLNALAAKGQTIDLPAGKYNRVYVLAAADGDQKATFTVGDRAVNVNVQNWTGFIGQWDDRVWEATETPIAQRPGAPAPPAGQAPRMRRDQYGKLLSITPGFTKRADVAWFASHHHDAAGANVDYSYSYVFAYPIDIPAGATKLTLPNNASIRVLAISVANENPAVVAVQPLYDTLERTPATVAQK
ncbi:MAG TPA: glycoside hydrolase family 38 C-terminal domain-containing protein [Candidatus Sulfopaludibacter sp.]|nr:glycoside hydrolase family 38 C-terminal domain-containing protein [Candidatus Sulfopaludibacter sp.]